MLDRKSGKDEEKRELVRAVEAADRAGAIVTEQVRSIIDAAEASAEEVRRNAHRDAEAILQESKDSANRVLERLNSVEGPLADLVGALRGEADSLSAELDRRAGR